MNSPQSVVSPLKTTSLSKYEKQKTNLSVKSKEINFQEKKLIDSDDFIGVLEVYIHQARDIHNICIYQKQDVYVKLCLTTHPENTVSTKIINRGGRNPIFDENLSLDISKIDSSLKCEIWMRSRVNNYLDDQLLGFSLVPVSEILVNNGKLQRDFSLSSTDLFHSPAGFVDLSVSLVGAVPEVIPISAPPSHDSVSVSQLSELDKIEFPDFTIVNENNHMVQEYLDNKIGSDDEKRVGPEQSPPSDYVLSTNGASSDQETRRKDIVSSHTANTVLGKFKVISYGKQTEHDAYEEIEHQVSQESEHQHTFEEMEHQVDQETEHQHTFMKIEQQVDSGRNPLEATEESKKERDKTSFNISYEVLQQHLGKKIDDVIKELGVSRSTFKRIIRSHGITRWPCNVKNKKNPSIFEASNANKRVWGNRQETLVSSSNIPPCFGQNVLINTDTIGSSQYHIDLPKTDDVVTIKAKFGDDTMKIQFCKSSKMEKLIEELVRRFNLRVGSFKLKYFDEDDEWMLLACDDDLKLCIKTLTSLGKTPIRVSVQSI